VEQSSKQEQNKSDTNSQNEESHDQDLDPSSEITVQQESDTELLNWSKDALAEVEEEEPTTKITGQSKEESNEEWHQKKDEVKALKKRIKQLESDLAKSQKRIENMNQQFQDKKGGIIKETRNKEKLLNGRIVELERQVLAKNNNTETGLEQLKDLNYTSKSKKKSQRTTAKVAVNTTSEQI